MAEIPVRVESVCDQVSVNTIHGWQSCRLVKFEGSLYASAGALKPGEKPGDMQGSGQGLLFRRDPDGKWAPIAELKAVKEYELPGTDVLEGYVIHTLRPERFGGESDGNTVHLLSVKQVYQADGKTVAHGELWHAAFDLPKAR